MSDNPYETMMPQGPFGKVTDKAIEEANAAYLKSLEDPEVLRREQESAERWRSLLAAEDVTGEHGVVLPLALAEDLLKVLDGKQARLPRRLLVDSLRQRTQQAHQRKPEPKPEWETRVIPGVWRHEDGTECHSYPDSFQFTYVGPDDRIHCQHGVLHCERKA
jgi:hypothetical protein